MLHEHEVRFRASGGRRGRGRPTWAGGGGDVPPPAADDVAEWLAGRLPDGWYTAAPDVTVDRDEIVVVGPVTPPLTPNYEGNAAASGRIARFREETRAVRVAIAREAEERYGRTLSWGARIGDYSEVFTNASVPVMTRLRQPERRVLDTLVAGGVARSRSEALAWCVRLVGQHEEDWIKGLRDALAAVEEARARGPEMT